jgi:phosphopantothenoylcysteine decarboxylase
MNTAMWRHPVTKKQIRVLEDEWGVGAAEGGWVEVMRPIEKELACGDVGIGAMREYGDIVKLIELRLSLSEEWDS